VQKTLWFLVLTWIAAVPAAAVPEAPLVPRVPADKQSWAAPPATTAVEAVVVKFHEGTEVRLKGQGLSTLPRGARASGRLAALGLTAEQVEADLLALPALFAAHPLCGGLGRLFSASAADLAAWRAEGEALSGRELADLDLYLRVPVAVGTVLADVEDLVADLNALASVEIAYGQSPAIDPIGPFASFAGAGDIPPTTPNFEPQQGYLDPAPGGIDARYAWTLPGGRGQTVRIVDVEGAWNTSHEDLPALFHQGGGQDPDWLQHGTAVLGVLAGKNNGFGVTGIAHGAQVGVESFADNEGTANAIVHATAAAGAGGLVLVEVQLGGPVTPGTPCSASCTNCCDCVPVEYAQAEYDAIAQATALGVTVVEAGANGATDLDDPVYGNLFNRLHRDSGAVVVGASTGADRTPACFTNFGSRIDVHGWGGGVVTTGYGDLFDGGGDPNQLYTAGFSGTSSASPLATGAAAALQGISRAHGQGSLGPGTLRQLLRDTGTPQAADPRRIGPLPNLFTASGWLLSGHRPDTPGIVRANWFHLRNQNSSGGASLIFPYGIATDLPVTGDWNGDGIDTIGVFRDGTFFLRNTNSGGNGELAVTFGAPGDQPLVGDWNGDGTDTVGYFRNGTFHLRNANTPGRVPEIVFPYGLAGDLVLAGDWDGDGIDTVGVFRPSDGTMRLRNANTAGPPDIVLSFGTAGDRPVAGDWDGDGVDTVGVYRNGFYFLRNFHTSGPADVAFSYGTTGDLPVVGDWNGWF
jgi:serine protease